MTGSKRNNILAGLFVVIAVVLAVMVSFLLAERGAGSGATRFMVVFALQDGAAGLQEGSPVKLGGQPVGRVNGVEFAHADAQRPEVPTGVAVRVEVRRDVVLFEDATIALERPLLGTLSSINIASTGTPDGDLRGATPAQGKSWRVEAGDIVRASPGPGLLAQAGLGPAQLEQIKTILASASTSLQRLETLIGDGGPDARATLADARAIVADLKTRLADWNARVDATLANVEEASGRLRPVLDDAGALIAEARSVVRDNRERIDDLVATLQRAGHKLEGETLDTLNEAMRRARTALDEVSVAMKQVGELVREQSPNLRRTMANLRLMSDQLKLTAVEVRSQPWRLLHQPTTKELSAQVLYDATRSYATAASDVRAAAEAVGAVAAAEADPAARDERLAELIRVLGESMQKFHDAEQALLQKLIEDDGR